MALDAEFVGTSCEGQRMVSMRNCGLTRTAESCRAQAHSWGQGLIPTACARGARAFVGYGITPASKRR
jgi:hypothetical protein